MLEPLFIAAQRAVPARALGRLVHALARNRNPMVKDLLIRGFVRLYDVDVTEAAAPVPAGYESFNAFFTRTLRPGARPTDPAPDALLCPADGTVQQLGPIEGEELLQVKGVTFGIAGLLGDADAARLYRDGSFVTIYLAPWNYHRVHMPATGRVVRMTHVPGELWSVNATTAARVPRLFARNERLVCQCEADWGCFAVVLVGALNVGSISTEWAGEVLPRRSRSISHWDYAPATPATSLRRGDTLGSFNMGSTVIVLLPPGVASWNAGLTAGMKVRACERIGRLQPGGPTR
jgi:phosphatidylserine decarboxylase